MEHRVFRLALIAGILHLAHFHSPFEIRTASGNPSLEGPGPTKWSATLSPANEIFPAKDEMLIANCLGVGFADSYEDAFDSLDTHIKLNGGMWIDFPEASVAVPSTVN